MPILTKEVKVKPNGKTIKYYESLGYEIPKKTASYNKTKFVYDYSKTFMVKVDDLQKRSDIKIDVLCDYCYEEIMTMTYDQYTQRTKEINKIACKHCSPQKVKEVSLLRYGVDNYAKTQECREKMKSTMINLYGVENPMLSDEIREKSRQTCIERYGTEYALQSEKVKGKKYNTLIEHYGVDVPAKHPDIRKKMTETLYKNGSQKTSKQQLYLNTLYNGELNYPICYYNADICLLNEKIVIEYDGGGHDLDVRLGRITEKEHNRREFVRSILIKKEGYKQIRISSLKDKLPSDDILLKMLSDAKKYFDTTSRSWIFFDIDNSKMINAENKETNGVYYDYGQLHIVRNAKICLNESKI